MRLNSLQPGDAVAKREKLHPDAAMPGDFGGEAMAFVRQFKQVSNNLPAQYETALRQPLFLDASRKLQ